MSCRVEPVTATPREREEIAAFLAAISRDGDHPFMEDCDADPALWLKRFRWWWDENPWCQHDSPRGFVLRTEDGAVVGFQGLIPQDYECAGATIPGLLSATLYVDPKHRDSSAGLLLRVVRLTRSFHLTDSAPIEKLTELMERFGAVRPRHYHAVHAPVWRHLLPLRRGRTLVSLCGVKGKIVSDAGEIQRIAPQEEEFLAPKMSPEAIRWRLEHGVGGRHFRGWLDESGTLHSWLFAHETRQARCAAWAVDGFGGSRAVPASALVQALRTHPEAAGLPRGVKLLTAYSSDADALSLPAAFRRTVPLQFYYFLPPEAKALRKRCMPMDGEHGWV